MRVTEIFESRIPPTKQDLSGLPLIDLAQLIFKDCSEFFSDTEDDQNLYRGRYGQQLNAFSAVPTNNRITLDSNETLTNWLNQVLKSRNIQARRDNSIFVIGDPGSAAGYGSIYKIFPANGYHYTWGKQLFDMTLGIKEGLMDGWLKFTKAAPTQLAAMAEKLPDGREKDVYNALITEIKGKKRVTALYNFNTSAPIWDILIAEPDPLLYLDADQFDRAFGLVSDRDISDAIYRKGEIWISGKYYAVRRSDRNIEFTQELDRLRSRIER